MSRLAQLALVLALAVLGLGRSASAQRAGDKPEDATQRIVALDPRWTVTLDTPPAAPAGYDEQSAYVPLKGGTLLAVSLDRGDIVWQVTLATPTTPATGDGLVFAAADGAVTALEQRKGATIWRTPLDQPIDAPLHWDAGWVFASTEPGDLVALRADSGELLWQQPLGSAIAVPPSASGERIYAGLRDGRIVSLDMETGAIVWSVPLTGPITGLLALEDQLLAGTRQNRLHSLNLTSGRIRWTQKAGADIIGSPVADEDQIYFAAMDNLVRALDRDSGSVEWTRPLTSRPGSGPLRVADVVLVPLVSTDIAAFYVKSGQPAFTIKAAGELGGVPFLREAVRPTAPLLIAISRDGKLQGFGSRFDPVPGLLPDLPGVKVTGN